MSQAFELMNAVKSDELGHSVIYLLSRDAQRLRQTHKIVDFDPHFWVQDPTGTETDLFENPIVEVTKKLSGEVGQLVKQLGRENTCEGDILFPWRYLIDKQIKCSYEVSNNRIQPCKPLNIPMHKGFFDLEVETPPEIMANPMDPKWPIVSFQFSNNYTPDLDLFMLQTKVPLERSIDLPKDINGRQLLNNCVQAGTFTKSFTHKWGTDILHPNVYLYEDEKAFIYDVSRWAAWKEFDVRAGWNSLKFDDPYWIRRAKLLGVDIKPLSPFGTVVCQPRPDQEGKLRMDPYVKGVQLVDLMEMYKKWSGGRQPIVKGRPFGLTYDFHLVLEYECGFYYIDLGDRVKESRASHPDDWATYCLGDAFGLHLLDTHKGITKYFDRLRRIVGVPLESSLHNSRLIDMRLLRLRDKPLPTKRMGKKEKVTGAIVFLPKIGLHENVAYIDEKSLYPTLIRLYNLSPETLVLDKEKWILNDIVVGPMEDGTLLHFRKSPEGLFPKAVRFDMDEREVYRKQLRGMSDKNPRYEETKQLETLYKFLSCSYYGVTGYVGFRLMNKWVRKAITFLGREALEECSKDAARAGYPRYYGDTDGLFFKLMTNDPGEGRIVESIVNKTLQRIALRRGASFQVEAKYEHFCKRIIFVPKITKRKGKIIAAKKNYAYTDEHDNLFVTGLAPRRSATAAATRELMMPWLETVLIKNDVPAATEAIRTAWRDLPNYPMNKIGMPRGIHKAQYGSYRIIKGKKVFKKTRNPWLDGMTYMKKRYGKMFREDKKPLLIWMRGTHVEKSTSKLVNQESGCNTDVICITENDTEIPVALKPFVDWERMRRLVLKNRFKPLFEAIGISWEEVIVRQKQTAFSHKSSKFKIKKSTVMERSLQKQTTLM